MKIEARTDLSALFLEIQNGEHDNNLTAIENAIAARRDRIKVHRGHQVAAQLAPGDEARITGGIRPHYMVGVVAEVVKVNRKRVVLKMMKTHSPRFPQGAQVTVPLTCVERIG